MKKQVFTEDQIEQLRNDLPWLNWEVTFENRDLQEADVRQGPDSASRPVFATCELVVADHDELSGNVRRYQVWSRASLWLMAGAGISFLTTTTGFDHGLASAGVLFGALGVIVFGVACYFSYRTANAADKYIEYVMRVEDGLPDSEVILDDVDAAWIPAIYLDRKTSDMMADRILGRREIDHLESKISKGRRALRELRADDPMRDSVRIELAALEDRLAYMKEIRADAEGVIDEAARQYYDERTILNEGRERLKSQETAHDWLYGEE